MRRALGRLINSFGFEVQLYASGRECLDEKVIDRTACLIVDVSMPQMDGFELHAMLEESGRNVPTVYISGHVGLGYREQAAALDAVAFLPKPCDGALLRDAIESALASNDACRSQAEFVFNGSSKKC
jgi:FixJ family two-component response regulator